MQIPADEAAVERLFKRGEAVIPGGVCSSTRRNKAWNSPVYAQRAAGSRFWDVAGREFLDFSMSHGATLLGHAPECLRHVFDTTWEHGVLCSMDTPFHVDLAEQLCRIIPCAERVRFTNSGSEATLHALRLCRAASGRDKIIRFFGHFHGYHEFTYIGGHPPADQLDARAFITGSSIQRPFTLEGNFIFPFRANKEIALKKASLFGMHSVRGETGTNKNDLTWATPAGASVQVYTNKYTEYKDMACFVLTSSAGLFTAVSSSYFPDIYNKKDFV